MMARSIAFRTKVMFAFKSRSNTKINKRNATKQISRFENKSIFYCVRYSKESLLFSNWNEHSSSVLNAFDKRISILRLVQLFVFFSCYFCLMDCVFIVFQQYKNLNDRT